MLRPYFCIKRQNTKQT